MMFCGKSLRHIFLWMGKCYREFLSWQIIILLVKQSSLQCIANSVCASLTWIYLALTRPLLGSELNIDSFNEHASKTMC